MQIQRFRNIYKLDRGTLLKEVDPASFAIFERDEMIRLGVLSQVLEPKVKKEIGITENGHDFAWGGGYGEADR